MNPLTISWEQLGAGLHPELIRILEEELGFRTVMPVQKAVVPLLLKNYDVAVESCTGSGKTLAFVVPIINKLLLDVLPSGQDSNRSNRIQRSHDDVRCLIISPTRELALQTYQVICSITAGILKTTSVHIGARLMIGGHKSMKPSDVEKISGSEILVATPGRLREILYEKHNAELNLKALQFLIMDEADRLIEGNHRFDVKDILSKIPKQRRTGLFSATLNNVNIEELIKLGLRNPAKVRIKSSPQSFQLPLGSEDNAHAFSLPVSLENSCVIFSSRLEKILYLHSKLQKRQSAKVMLFFNTCASVDFYTKTFQTLCPHLSIWKIHGQLDQSKRLSVFKQFNEVSSGVLITTDVVARGVDFEGVDAIYQIDPPQNPENFIHRVGRTARGMASGKACILLEKSEEGFISYLEQSGLSFKNKKHKDVDLQAESQFKDLMLTDKDYLMKAKKAFVSFVRSYKEHFLKDVFRFDQLNVNEASRSFFLPIVPKIKELSRMPGKRVSDEEYWEKAQKVAFLDSNQQRQYEEKASSLLQKREQLERRKNLLRKKAEKEQHQKKKRSYSDRKKAKTKEVEREFEELGEETRLAKRLKKGLITEDEYDRQVRRLDKRNGNFVDF